MGKFNGYFHFFALSGIACPKISLGLIPSFVGSMRLNMNSLLSEYTFILLILVLVLLFFAFVGLGTFICYKKQQKSKKFDKEEKEKPNPNKTKKDLCKKTSTDNFTIPIVAVPQQVPFSFQDDAIQLKQVANIPSPVSQVSTCPFYY